MAEMSKPKSVDDIPNTIHNRNKHRNERAQAVRRNQRKECGICCSYSTFFGVGPCFHPICMECSIRLRIIGQSKTCPQCRDEIDTLYFDTVTASQTAFVLPKSTIHYEQAANYGIKFVDVAAIPLFNNYMAHKCSKCPDANLLSFPTFAALHQHVAGVHHLSFCYLCTENVNVLSKDRKLYSRENLLKHMDGKLREPGFQGHPKCFFCDQRFFDREEQYKHLRKDHFYCAICEEDGVQENSFYRLRLRNRNALSRHYRMKHCPCRYPECEEIPIAFRDRTELAIHKAREHHERNSQLDFAFTRNLKGNGGNQSQQQSVSRQQEVNRSDIITVTPSAQANLRPVRIVPSSFNQENEFPNLPSSSHHAPPTFSSLQQGSSSTVGQNRLSVSLSSTEQFPSLTSVPVKQGPLIWVKGDAGNAFKAGTQTRPKQGNTKRKPVVVERQRSSALLSKLDVWSEEMRRKREEQLMNLRDNEVKESKEIKPKKEKKKKSKTIPKSALAGKSGNEIQETQSVFQALHFLDETSQMSGSSKSSNMTKETTSRRN